jgi:hypothetical protein
MSDLKDLEPLSKRINAASDELTKALDSIQRRVNELGLGVEIWLEDPRQELRREIIETSDVESRRVMRLTELGYGRMGDGWGLLVRTRDYRQELSGSDWEYKDGDATIIDIKPLLKAARGIRVRAVRQIPELIEQLRATAAEIIDSIEAAQKIADSLK